MVSERTACDRLVGRLVSYGGAGRGLQPVGDEDVFVEAGV